MRVDLEARQRLLDQGRLVPQLRGIDLVPFVVFELGQIGKRQMGKILPSDIQVSPSYSGPWEDL